MAAITVERAGAEPERRELAAPCTAGGSLADELHLPGAPPAALRLVPCRSGVVVEPLACGVHVAGRPVGPGSRRLLRPGERAELQGMALSLDPDVASDSTRSAAASLLRDVAAGAVPAGGAYLVVLTGPTAGARHALRASQTLGRGRAAGIRIPDARASRLHARLRRIPGGAFVEDLASKNGVRVNGVRIDRRGCALRAGDELGIGDTELALGEGLAAEGGPSPEGSRLPRRGPAGRRAAAAALLALSAAALALAAL